MPRVQFVAKIFEHDGGRFGCYIPQVVTEFYGLDADALTRETMESRIVLRTMSGDEYEALTFQAYRYRKTIRVLVPNFWNADLAGQLAEVSIH